MKRYYVIADLRRAPSDTESMQIPAGGQMYAGCVKAVITAETAQAAMDAGKRCITGALKHGIIPFRWSYQDADWADSNGEKEIYAKYKTVTWLASYRVQAGLTQQQLADISGVNVRQIRRVELGEADAGNLTAKNLLALADALGVDLRDLI